MAVASTTKDCKLLWATEWLYSDSGPGSDVGGKVIACSNSKQLESQNLQAIPGRRLSHRLGYNRLKFDLLRCLHLKKPQ